MTVIGMPPSGTVTGAVEIVPGGPPKRREPAIEISFSLVDEEEPLIDRPNAFHRVN